MALKRFMTEQTVISMSGLVLNVLKKYILKCALHIWTLSLGHKLPLKAKTGCLELILHKPTFC